MKRSRRRGPVRGTVYPYHFHCTYILSRGERPTRLAGAGLPEGRTHACWCSAWRLEGTAWMVWRNSRWVRPAPGELRMTEKAPPVPEAS